MFGGCLVNEKLKGFASDGRDLDGAAPGEASATAYERGDFEGAPLAEDGPWSDGSDSDSDSDSGDESEGETCTSDDDNDDDDDDVTLEDAEPGCGGKPAAVLEQENDQSSLPNTPATGVAVKPELDTVPTSAIPASPNASPTDGANEQDMSLTATPCPVAAAGAATAAVTTPTRAVVANLPPTATEEGIAAPAPASEPASCGEEESGRTSPLSEIAKEKKESVAVIETPSASSCLNKGLLKDEEGRLDGAAVMPPAPPPLRDAAAAGDTEGGAPLKEEGAVDGAVESETGAVGA